jgi:tetratricopeptide (TPR) repeat protein
VARAVRFVLPVFLVAGLTAQTTADRASYAALVDQYTRGNIDQALAGVARLPQSAVTDATRRYRDRLPAAAMLHTDFANNVIDATPSRATFHIEQARTLVRAMLDRGKSDPDAIAFARRWYEFVATIYIARTYLDEAARIIRDGLSQFSNDPILYVAQGTILEMQVVVRQPDLSIVSPNLRRVPSAPTFNSGRRDNQTPRLLEAAAAEYRHALDFDAHQAEAHLRLGWVHLQLRDNRAPAELQQALADAGDAPTRYLAHLFLGAFAERERRWTDALREYDGARQADDRAASACVAASHIEDVVGHADRARQIALDCLQLPKTDDDPWWRYRLGAIDVDTLSWLRTSVRFQP